uniref:Uncharacterized protein n=1 Tax=Anas platyrhynchos platyrhynchos TaxID=8840 RepID=A0A493U2M9_ANAPP
HIGTQTHNLLFTQLLCSGTLHHSDLFHSSPELLQCIFPSHCLLFQSLACPLFLGHLFFQVLEQSTGKHFLQCFPDQLCIHLCSSQFSLQFNLFLTEGFSLLCELCSEKCVLPLQLLRTQTACEFCLSELTVMNWH